MSIVDELISVDFITHNWPQALQGRDGFKVYYRCFKKIFPTARFIILDLIAEENRVVVYWKLKANQQESDQNANNAAQKKISFEGAIIYRLEKEQFKECWMISNHQYHKKILSEMPLTLERDEIRK